LRSHDASGTVALQVIKQVLTLRIANNDLDLLDEGPDDLVNSEDLVRMLLQTIRTVEPQASKGLP